MQIAPNGSDKQKYQMHVPIAGLLFTILEYRKVRPLATGSTLTHSVAAQSSEFYVASMLHATCPTEQQHRWDVPQPTTGERRCKSISYR